MKNKKALFIAPLFFNYPHLIMEELSKQGWEVDYYDDRPSQGAFVKGMIKIKKDLMNGLIESYFNKILNETKGKNYDLVFIIAAKVFTSSMIDELRGAQQQARFVLYLWDSVQNYPHIEELISSFDKVYSFDTEDCKTYKEMEFLPLFYSNSYKILAEEKSSHSFKYDISSIGTAHPNRYIMFRKLERYFQGSNVKLFLYMFLASRLLFFYNKLFEEDFKTAKLREFKFVPLNEKQVLDVVRDSKAVLDIQHHQQSGLTMRTVECLGAKKKIITTNTNIKQYDFYHPNNICIIENENFEKINEFLTTNYMEIDQDIYTKYSLTSWLKTITQENS